VHPENSAAVVMVRASNKRAGCRLFMCSSRKSGKSNPVKCYTYTQLQSRAADVQVAFIAIVKATIPGSLAPWLSRSIEPLFFYVTDKYTLTMLYLTNDPGTRKKEGNSPSSGTKGKYFAHSWNIRRKPAATAGVGTLLAYYYLLQTQGLRESASPAPRGAGVAAALQSYSNCLGVLSCASDA
jgi:hypothetical protein